MNEISKLEKTVKSFCQFIEDQPGSDIAEQAWGPREVLAHLVFHHERYVVLAEASLYSTPCEPLDGKYRVINAAAVALNRDKTVGSLLERFGTANQRLADIYAHNDPGCILVEIKAGVKVRSLEELIPEVEAHIRNHLVKLRKTQKATD